MGTTSLEQNPTGQDKKKAAVVTAAFFLHLPDSGSGHPALRLVIERPCFRDVDFLGN